MISNAKQMLFDNGYTCVVIKNDFSFTSRQRGVKPLLELIDSETDVINGVAADKVVGKAAAFLYAVLGVKEIYADVISELALDTLQKNGILVSFGEVVAMIKSRDGKGFCPMEQATLDLEDKWVALEVIRDTVKALAQKNGSVKK